MKGIDQLALRGRYCHKARGQCSCPRVGIIARDLKWAVSILSCICPIARQIQCSLNELRYCPGTHSPRHLLKLSAILPTRM